ncbi:hypothetical protein BD560DRAFT_451094 [Blakeslea trispora]|nr:hypothetical protein BD560DRAFT_451094 [Blakeslea trispora]
MPRFISLVTGLAVATAVTYKLREHLVEDQDNIKNRLESAKSSLEQAVEQTSSYSRPSAYLSDSQRYVSDRLVPSVKDSWNSQIMNTAHSLVKVDIGSQVKKLWDEQVYPSLKDIVNK